MKILLIIFSLVIGINGIGTNASAGILLEPYLGYHVGGYDESATDFSGTGFGVRAGWTLPLVFIALDYSTASLDVDNPTTADTEADATDLGLVVGASLPILRVWAGYNFDSEFDVTGTGKYEGTSMKAGAGFKIPILPISINAEYILSEHDKLNGANLSQDFQTKTLFISVSAPLTF